MKKLQLIGDSIRMGYQPFVTEMLQGKAEVWGPEGNGGPSSRLLEHIEDWFVQPGGDVIYINAGLHDLKKDLNSDVPHIPLHQYQANLDNLFKELKKRCSATLLWARTTPVNEKNHHVKKGFDRWEKDVVAYNQAADEVAQKHGISTHDLYGEIMAKGRDTILRQDGVHFIEEGYRFLAKSVTEFCNPYL